MSRGKHLFVIHGRSTKPAESVKKKLVMKALRHGLDRVDPGGAASRRINRRDIKCTFVYYGDIANTRMLEKNGSLRDKLTDIDPKHGTPCEPPDRFIEPLERLFAVTDQTKKAYKKFLAAHRDLRGLDNVASMVSWVANLSGLSDNLIKAATADMGAYLMERKVGSAIRERLAGPLRKALLAGDDICLVSHSMGCIVSYDVLWKFSQMSEYKKIQESGARVTDWLTIGNPLGEPGVRKNLYDANERGDGRYPKKIITRWLNIPARDDFVSHDNTIEDDFREMGPAGYKFVESIQDHPEVYTFWATDKGTNPHKLYGYLDNTIVAGRILQWMEG
ncbi:MAG: hypothetical protein RQ753_04780 [Desulfurivibrionaceae bacterium]|nr:hypothetical protein [Desulfobulbales bacterium]MDT8334991.1 hypothetical protein [Desulfurivibrionaceae bacterium]